MKRKCAEIALGILILFMGRVVVGQIVEGNTFRLWPNPRRYVPQNVRFNQYGTPGTTSNRFYWVSAVYGNGETRFSPAVQPLQGPSSLTATDFFRITWNLSPGAVSYNVVRTSSSTYPTTGTILLCSTTGSFCDDTGGTLATYTTPGSYVVEYVDLDQSTVSSIVDSNTVIDTDSFSQNGLISGCGVRWITGTLQFIVSECNYIIGGVSYTSPQATLTLGASDPVNDRIDGIIVNTSSVAAVLAGTPANPALAPAYDPATQIPITFSTVPALATTPANTSSELVYDENVEWTTSDLSTGGGTINFNSTTNPFTGTKNAATSTNIGPKYIAGFTRGSTITGSNYNNLVINIFLISWSNGTNIDVRFHNGSTPQKVAGLRHNRYGFNGNLLNQWQQVVIPISDFLSIGPSSTWTIDKLTFGLLVTGTNSVFRLDRIELQSGIPPAPSNVSMTYVGDWTASTTYTTNNVVTYVGCTYIAIAQNTNVNPSNTTSWQNLGCNTSGVYNGMWQPGWITFGHFRYNTTATQIGESAGSSSCAGGTIAGIAPSTTYAFASGQFTASGGIGANCGAWWSGDNLIPSSQESKMSVPIAVEAGANTRMVIGYANQNCSFLAGDDTFTDFTGVVIKSKDGETWKGMVTDINGTSTCDTGVTFGPIHQWVFYFQNANTGIFYSDGVEKCRISKSFPTFANMGPALCQYTTAAGSRKMVHGNIYVSFKAP